MGEGTPARTPEVRWVGEFWRVIQSWRTLRSDRTRDSTIRDRAEERSTRAGGGEVERGAMCPILLWDFNLHESAGAIETDRGAEPPERII